MFNRCEWRKRSHIRIVCSKKLNGVDLERVGYGLKCVDGRRILLPLDHTDIVAIQAGAVGNVFL